MLTVCGGAALAVFLGLPFCLMAVRSSIRFCVSALKEIRRP